MKRRVEKTQCEVVCLESWGKGLKYHISAWLCACTIQVGVWVAHALLPKSLVQIHIDAGIPVE